MMKMQPRTPCAEGQFFPGFLEAGASQEPPPTSQNTHYEPCTDSMMHHLQQGWQGQLLKLEEVDEVLRRHRREAAVGVGRRAGVS